MANEQETPASTPSESEQAPSSSPDESATTSQQKEAKNETLPKDIAERVRQTIQDAHELLDYAVADGLPVEEAIVDGIEQALCFLDASRDMTWTDCAKFEKAYRELAHTLSPLTIDEIQREKKGWKCWWKRYWRRILFALLFSLPLFFLGWAICPSWEGFLNCSFCNSWVTGGGTAVAGFLFMILLLRGADLFTGAVTNRKLNQLIRFCYVFTILAITFSVLPFLSSAFFPALPRILTLSPINVLQGCADPWPSDGANPAEIPKEIRCLSKENLTGNPAYQWLVNIGGRVVSIPDEHQVGNSKGGVTSDKQQGNSSELEVTAGEQSAGDSKSKACALDSGKFRDDHWRIQGGLAVPLYVIVLALMGSAVSMTRKVPEYQRRAFGLHVTLSRAQARENLVFQIMQVFSAPLIVMAAYYLLTPDTRTASVLVGFASGFASEPILLSIRGLADKLRPGKDNSSASPVLISVTVSPASVELSPGESQLFTVTVANSSNSAVTWSAEPSNVGTLSQTGLYTAPDVIPEKKIVTILAVSAADPTKRGSVAVTLTPAKREETR